MAKENDTLDVEFRIPETEKRCVNRDILNYVLDAFMEFDLPLSFSITKHRDSKLYKVTVHFSYYDRKVMEWVFERAEILCKMYHKI